MSGLQKDGTYELTPTKAFFYLRREIPKEFENLAGLELIQAILKWQGIRSEQPNKHYCFLKVYASQKQIWEALSGQKGIDGHP